MPPVVETYGTALEAKSERYRFGAKPDAAKSKIRHLGKGTNLVYWTKRDYSTATPGSRKTWTAPAGKVS
ncbi:hypothetical protein [Streptosporangium sp. NPDC049078]|uniref:hypothetical protein n=1 Tax=Streptosporangium sp. NPDC049078 TaxID=3155767 RepID=UPI00341B2145